MNEIKRGFGIIITDGKRKLFLFCHRENITDFIGINRNERNKIVQHAYSRISFWHDLWCGDMVLKVAFPSLFGIACVKDAFVADTWEVLGSSIKWNVSFTREAYDWELDLFASFFQVLHSVRER
jgi:hypothetical protein